MSLEDAISRLAHEVALNTAAMKELTLIQNGGKPFTGSTPGDDKTSPVPEYTGGAAINAVIPTKKPDTPAQTEEIVSSGNGASPLSETPPVAEEPTVALDLMKDVVPVFGKLCVAKGRDAGATILARWKVAKLSQIAANDLSALLSDINEAMAA